MNLKNYLKPNKNKILFSLLLCGIFLSIMLAPKIYDFIPFFLFNYISVIFYFAIILFYNIPFYFTITIFILLSYPFGCYISQSKKWIKGIFLYLVAILIVSFGMFLGVNAYNNTVGKYCNLDSDCKVTCGQGSLNNKGIPLEDPFIIFVSSCSEMDWAICKSNKCETFNIMNAASLQDCDRISDQFLKSNCYYHLARNLGDANICNKIESASFRENCIRQIK